MAAAASPPRRTSTMASFWTLVRLAASLAGWDSALMLSAFAFRHPGPHCLREIVRVFADELVEHVDSDNAGRRLHVSCAMAIAIPAHRDLADRNTNRNRFSRRFLESPP